MKIKVIAGDITTLDIEAVVVNLFEGVTKLGGATGAVDHALEGAITELIAEGEITGKLGELALIHTLGKMHARRVVVAGLGKHVEFSMESVRHVMGNTARFLRKLGVRRAATIAHGAGIGGMSPKASGQAMAEGTLLGLYRFRRYKSKSEDHEQRELEELQVVEKDKGKLAPIQQGLDRGQVLAEATVIARDMGNEPANVLSPTEMANRARQVAEETCLAFEALEKPAMEKLGMGALLAVAAGSDQQPKLIVMRYHGDPANKSNNIALIGKGVTFDSGGISIKPASGMGEMKGDMSGGAAVISAMRAIAYLKPRINVMAVVPATENMSGGSATRPGDVVRAMIGKSIEIENTDAEGRLILADAIGYARQQGQRRLVDVATLTGAAVVALGKITSAVMGNDQPLIDRVLKASDAAGERMWQLPLYKEYKEQITSSVADLKNTGGRDAGAITAAYFISEFAEDVPWVHLDIAGTSRTAKDRGFHVAGSTGVGVRTLVNLVEDLAENPD